MDSQSSFAFLKETNTHKKKVMHLYQTKKYLYFSICFLAVLLVCCVCGQNVLGRMDSNIEPNKNDPRLLLVFTQFKMADTRQYW